MDYQKELNEKQYEAVSSTYRHLRIIAGAGSGKTHVLTYRIAYLIDEIGVDPWKVLAITFTNNGHSIICIVDLLILQILTRIASQTDVAVIINKPYSFFRLVRRHSCRRG